MKKAIILDLDNTIYPVSSIAESLFANVVELIDKLEDQLGKEAVENAKDELKRRPYQQVADKYNFDESAKKQGLHLLQNLEYHLPMQPYPDYKSISETSIDKYLVTTGFTKLQWSKIRQLGIEQDFKAIYIVDPQISSETKRDVFTTIMKANNYSAEDVLIIGDDPESEIKAASGLGIDTFLFDPENRHPNANVTHRSTKLNDSLLIIA